MAKMNWGKVRNQAKIKSPTKKKESAMKVRGLTQAGNTGNRKPR